MRYDVGRRSGAKRTIKGRHTLAVEIKRDRPPNAGSSNQDVLPLLEGAVVAPDVVVGVVVVVVVSIVILVASSCANLPSKTPQNNTRLRYVGGLGAVGVEID